MRLYGKSAGSLLYSCTHNKWQNPGGSMYVLHRADTNHLSSKNTFVPFDVQHLRSNGVFWLRPIQHSGIQDSQSAGKPDCSLTLTNLISALQTKCVSDNLNYTRGRRNSGRTQSTLNHLSEEHNNYQFSIKKTSGWKDQDEYGMFFFSVW